MPDDLADVTVQRVVVRNGLSMDLADKLLEQIDASVKYLDGLERPAAARGPGDHAVPPLGRQGRRG